MRFLTTVLLICAALTSTAVGQSLSIFHQGNRRTNYWIQASAPVNTPQTLQASGNLHLWVDIQDQIQDQYSAQLAGVGVTQRVMVAQLSQRFFRLIPSAPAVSPITVMLIGDSMTADCCGWGRGIYGFFNANATVVNYAVAYASTKTFLAASDELTKMLVVKPDYVLIQFGFMDQGLVADRATTLKEFHDNLKMIVNTVRGFNGVPILITLHAARDWDFNGRIIPAWQDRNAVTTQVAAETHTDLIDLNALTTDLLNQLGPTGSQFMHWPDGAPEDNMHLSQLGGQVVSQLVVNALPDALGPYLTGILDAPPIP